MRFGRIGSYGLAGRLLLIFAGVWWCVQTVRGFGDDLHAYRTTKLAEVRRGIMASWVIAVVGMVVVGCLVPGVVRDFAALFR